MNSKKDVLIASILAIMLGAGLGAVSYSFFADMPFSETPRKTLDLYTQKGGLGANKSGGIFEPFDNIFLYAYSTKGGEAIQNVSVEFILTNPKNVEFSGMALTNETGIATFNFTLSSDQFVIGEWQVWAIANVTEEVVGDIMSFNCQSLNAQLNVYTRREDLASTVFLPKEDVSVEARVAYKDASLVGVQVNFEVRSPNNAIFLTQSSITNTLGIANITFQIPWPSENALGFWHTTVESVICQQLMNATVDFECQLHSIVLDVYTQKGGFAPNEPSESFVLNETVYLYAEIRDALNETVPDKLISFEVRGPDGTTILIRATTTNASGVATVIFRIPLDVGFIGTWEVYARGEYNETVVLDTVTFRCEQQG